MDILERINQLRKEKGWSVNRLALESGLTQSTLFNLFYRKSSPSIKTLESICQGLGITLRDFFNEHNDKNLTQLSDEENFLINKLRAFDEDKKKLVKDLINNI